MKTKRLTTNLTVISLVLLGAAVGRAQTNPNTPPNGAAVAAPIGSAANTPYVFTLDAPYAFRFHRLGVSAEAGEMFTPQNFLGVEFSYWDALPHGYNVYSSTPFGPINVTGLNDGSNSVTSSGEYFRRVYYREDVTTVDLAYRYYLPLSAFASESEPTPFRLYFGASVGPGWVRNDVAGVPKGVTYDESDPIRFSGELLAGVQWDVSNTIDFRAGYRFIYLANVHRPSYETSALDSGALEAGLSFRF